MTILKMSTRNGTLFFMALVGFMAVLLGLHLIQIGTHSPHSLWGTAVSLSGVAMMGTSAYLILKRPRSPRR